MQLLFYNLFLFLYTLVLRIASLFDEKAKQWVQGRRDLIQIIKSTLPHGEERVWIHCASLGEFEQSRPLIEKIKNQYPTFKVVLTFFSPSGYVVRKDYELADYVFYLPMDGWRTSARFVKLINPSLAIFVKYEFWYYYLCNLKAQKIPTILIAAAFRESQPFFKWYGGFFRKILKCFHYLFVQDERSKKLLADIGFRQNVMVAGDTRYDRVAEIVKSALDLHFIQQFQQENRILIAGSTWHEDEKILKEAFSILPQDWKMIIAPHEINKSRIRQVKEIFGNDALLYSELSADNALAKRVIIIDNIGMLSSLYRYGKIAYVGGGFQKGGIHNTLEPAVFGLPVIFGPVYEKFVEAVGFVKNEFGFSIQNAEECKAVLQQLIQDDQQLKIKEDALKDYMQQRIGATEKIMKVIKTNELL